jgi:hypothetical protein
MEKHQEKIILHINTWLQEYGDSELTNIFEIGIQTCSPSWNPDIKYVSPKWEKAVNAQSKIGWQHIFQGRIAKEMIISMDNHYHSEGTHTQTRMGEQWARKLIRTIWDTLLSLWKERNSILHKRDEEIAQAHQQKATEQRVRKCYAYKDNLRHAERVQWFSETLHDMLKKHNTPGSMGKNSGAHNTHNKTRKEETTKGEFHYGEIPQPTPTHKPKYKIKEDHRPTPAKIPSGVKTRLTNSSLPSEESSVRVCYPHRVTR